LTTSLHVLMYLITGDNVSVCRTKGVIYLQFPSCQ